MPALRNRLRAVMIAIVVLTAALVGFVSTRLARIELKRMMLAADASRLEPVVRELEAAYARDGDWRGAMPLLRRAAELAAGDVVLANERGAIEAVVAREEAERTLAPDG